MTFHFAGWGHICVSWHSLVMISFCWKGSHSYVLLDLSIQWLFISPDGVTYVMRSSEMSFMSGPITLKFLSLFGKAIRELCFAENPIKLGFHRYWQFCRPENNKIQKELHTIIRCQYSRHRTHSASQLRKSYQVDFFSQQT